MGRLDDIVARNKHPRRHRRAAFPIGIGLSLFVLLILVLMIFTDLDAPPKTTSEPAETSAPPEKGRVRGIMLYGEPRRDAGSAAR
ncbi:MAG: hypothetical protein HOV81_07170 [Kofleriaceae bacterium]|nr:hypothetical protein [Kofleriaceae bacterium]